MSLELNSATTAVLVCHLQHDIIENDQTMGAVFAAEATRRDVVLAAGKLINAARTGLALPVLLRIAWRPDLSNMLDNIPLARMAAGMNACIDGQAGAELVTQLSPVSGDVVVTHHLPNPFLGTDLQAILQRRAVNTLVVCGVATNMAVLATIFAAADLGYRIILAEDACSARSYEAHMAALETIEMLATISWVEELVAALH